MVVVALVTRKSVLADVKHGVVSVQAAKDGYGVDVSEEIQRRLAVGK